MSTQKLLTICLVGAESTGKTTLAQALAKHFGTVWVPEYGRMYAEGKVFLPTYSEWETHEFTDIAEGQIRLTRQLRPRANRYLFQDTDALATSVWHRRYMRSPSLEVEKLAATSMADLYLVSSPDVPFVQDGTRDGEHMREWMHKEFIDVLTQVGASFFVISGPYSGRMKQAVVHIKEWQTKNDE